MPSLSSRAWRKLVVSIFATVLIVGSIAWIPGLSSVRGLIWWAFTPVAKILQSVGISVTSSFHFLTDRGSIKQENERLKKMLEQNITTSVSIEELQKENDQLREQLGFRQHSQLPSIEANIIGRDAFGTSQQVTIDHGTVDGVLEGRGVVSASGLLVGIVTQASSHTAVVRLITDNRSVIPARVQETGAEGVTRGVHGLAVELAYIPINTPLSTGSIILTSGLSGDVPSGIVIGRVTDVKPSVSGVFHEATLQPAAFLDDIQKVYVLSVSSST